MNWDIRPGSKLRIYLPDILLDNPQLRLALECKASIVSLTKTVKYSLKSGWMETFDMVMFLTHSQGVMHLETARPGGQY